MLVIFVEFIDQLIDYPINRASLIKYPCSNFRTKMVKRILKVRRDVIQLTHGTSCSGDKYILKGMTLDSKEHTRTKIRKYFKSQVFLSVLLIVDVS